MRSIFSYLCAPLLGLALFLTLPASALADRPDLSVLPHSKQGIEELNDQHIRELRRVERACMASVGGAGAACVIGDMESYISQASPELQTFHELMPLDQRYNSERPWSWVEGRFRSLGVIPKPE